MADISTTTAASPRKKTSKARRAFLIGGGLVGGALAVGFTLASKRITNAQGFKPPALGGDVAFNAWLKLAPDNALIVQVPRQEMGQGIYTTLAMLVAEELDADWSKVRVEQAAINPVYANVTALGDSAPAAMQGAMMTTARLIGVQMTGGSTSTRDAWEPMRAAAASARAPRPRSRRPASARREPRTSRRWRRAAARIRPRTSDARARALTRASTS